MAQTPKTRNHLVVGKNSKSYDDKHPQSPVSLHPIHDAIAKIPKLRTQYGLTPDKRQISVLRRLRVAPRMVISAVLAKMNLA